MDPATHLPPPALYAAGLWVFLPALALSVLADVLTVPDLRLGVVEVLLWQVFVWLYPLVGSGLPGVLGFVLLAVGTYRTPRFPAAVAGGALAVLAHLAYFQVAPVLGEALFYAGAGLAALPVRPRALAAATVAVVGLLVSGLAGQILTFAAVLWLAVLLVLAGRGERLAARAPWSSAG